MTEPTEYPTFDPYRFGAPEHPVPPEFAPPGYQGTGYQPPPPAQPAQQPQAVGPDAQQNPNAPDPYAPNPNAPDPYAQQPYGQQPYGQQPYGQQPYGQQPYGRQPQGYPPGYPAPPMYHQYAQPRAGSGKAVAGLVLGILAVIFCWTSVFDLLLIGSALLFSLLGLSDARRGSGGRGMAIAGLVLVAVGTVAATIVTVAYVRFEKNLNCDVSHAPGTFSSSVCNQRSN